jgi:hypothetical protein
MNEPRDEGQDEREERDKPSLMQRVHSATGDRDAEAEELQRRTPDVSKDDAKHAVQKAAGDLGIDEPAADDEMARADDARAARDEASD